MDTKPKKKFTTSQQTVINFLAKGWELVVSTACRPHSTLPRTQYWIQESTGGRTQKITKVTVTILQDLGLLRPAKREVGQYDAIYELNREGLAALA